MKASEPAPSRAKSGEVTRRQLLQAIPALAAAASVGSAWSAPAEAAPIDGVSSSTAAATSASTSLAVGMDMPFRTVERATADCGLRRSTEGSRNDPNPSPLEKIIAATSLAESRLGLANWPLLEEAEDPNLGHFTFPISPFNITADDGTEQFLLFSNNQVIANFRYGDYLERIQRRMFDRAVWAMRNGRMGTAVVEFDRPVTAPKVERIVRWLGYYGVKTIVWGNELNDPNTPWRDDLPAMFDILSAADATRKKYGLNDVELSLPGLAYYGHGEYLQKMLRTFKELQRKKYPAAPNDLPVQRVADHFYGPADTLLQRIRTIRGIMASEGVTQLKYDLTEMGNPTVDGDQQRASDLQMAEGHIPQVSSIAIASGLVDRISYYSLLDISTSHSIMQIQDGRLYKKPSYQAFVVMAKLLARLKTLAVTDERDYVRVDGRRTDNIAFQVLWSKVGDRDLWADVPKGARLFDAQGQGLLMERPSQIALKPKQHPALGGPARILIIE